MQLEKSERPGRVLVAPRENENQTGLHFSGKDWPAASTCTVIFAGTRKNIPHGRGQDRAR